MINKIKLIIYLDYCPIWFKWWPQIKQSKISMSLVFIIDAHSQIIMIIKNTKRSNQDKYRLCQLWNLLITEKHAKYVCKTIIILSLTFFSAWSLKTSSCLQSMIIVNWWSIFFQVFARKNRVSISRIG